MLNNVSISSFTTRLLVMYSIYPVPRKTCFTEWGIDPQCLVWVTISVSICLDTFIETESGVEMFSELYRTNSFMRSSPSSSWLLIKKRFLFRLINESLDVDFKA
ncbi:hypothetical protein CDAR_389191 [Caerostris darwini]|uniref:Uncharacterized protein n=1 Tax=Caerostris darwini TaxID=1538125 RepID=A0AAV4TNV7_9ARAC|nr:hypothetical protein CDAR_389191 [Caerostris darwini]